MCVRVRASVLCVCMCEGDRYRVGYLCLTLRVSSYTAEWAQPISTSLGGGEPWLRYRRSNLNYFKFRVGIILIALVLLYGCFVDDWVYLMEHKHIMISFLDRPEVSLRDIFFLMLTNGWSLSKNKNRRRVMFLHISTYYITDTIRSISSSSTRESTFQMLRKLQFVKNLLEDWFSDHVSRFVEQLSAGSLLQVFARNYDVRVPRWIIAD